MDLQNTPIIVELGCGASIQLANTVINTGSSGATIQFGGLEFPAATARAVAVPVNDINSEGPTRSSHSAGTSTRHAHLPAQRPTAETLARRTHLPMSRTATAENPCSRIFVFERLSQPKAPATKRIVTGIKISVKKKLKIRPTILNLEEKKQRIIEEGASADEVRVCTVCNVVCNSAKLFASHLAGQKHARKTLGPNFRTKVTKVMSHLKQMKDAKKSVPNKNPGLGSIAAPKIVKNFSCEVCKIECNSQETFNTHKLGKKHKANLQKLQEKITPKPTATSKKKISAGEDQTTNVEAVKKPSSTKEDLQTKKNKVVQGGASKEASMVCDLCDVVCNRKAVYYSHFGGKKHLAMLKKQETQI